MTTLNTPTRTQEDTIRKLENRILAAWQNGVPPGRVPFLKPERFRDPRARAVWAAILECGEGATSENYREVQLRAQEIAGLPVEQWYGFWHPITEETEYADGRTIERDAEQLATLMPTAAELPPPGAGLPVPPPVSALGELRYQVRTLADAFAPRPPVQWIVEGLIRQGNLMVIYGKSGTKKSFSALDLAMHVAAGKPWLGRYETKQCNVLIIDEESGDDRLCQRLVEVANGALAGPELPLKFISRGHFKLDNPGHAQVLKELIRANDAKLVFIDTLASHTTRQVDENSKQDMQAVWDVLRDIVLELGVTIVVIHHSGKNGLSRGSTVNEAAPDDVWHLKSDPDSAYLNIQTEKRRDGPPIRFSARAVHVEHPEDLMKNQFYLDDAPTQAKEMTKAANPANEFVLRYLREHGESEIAEIMDAADTCTDRAAANAVYRLVKTGLIRKGNPGHGGRGMKGRYVVAEPEMPAETQILS